jgi:hypothetical protein
MTQAARSIVAPGLLVGALLILPGCGVQRNFTVGKESSPPTPQPDRAATSPATPASTSTSIAGTSKPKAQTPERSPSAPPEPRSVPSAPAPAPREDAAPERLARPEAPQAAQEPPTTGRAAIASGSARAAASDSSIGKIELTAEPCTTVGRHVVLEIPGAEGLDPSYRGAVRGIEIRRSVEGGKAGFRHVRRQASRLEFDAWVRGGGWIFSFAGSGECRDGEAASARFVVIPHYR